MNTEVMLDSVPRLLDGAAITVQLVALSLAIGLVLSIPLAVMRASRHVWLNGPAYGYVFFFRGTPLLVQIFLVYYGLAQFEGVRQVPGPNYLAERGEVRVFRGEQQVATLYPEKRRYPIQAQPMTEAAIDVGVTRDLYVALGEPLGDGSWAVRLYYKPLVHWIWFGPALMALGGLLAASDRRYRRRAPAPRAAVELPAPEGDVATTTP